MCWVFFCYFPLQTKRKKDATTPSPALVPSGDYNTLSLFFYSLFIFFRFNLYSLICVWFCFVFSYRPAIIITITVKQKHNSFLFKFCRKCAFESFVFLSFCVCGWEYIGVLFGYHKARIEGLYLFFCSYTSTNLRSISNWFFGDRVPTIVEKTLA